MRGDSPSVSNDAHPPVANVADRLSTLLIDDEGSSIFLGSSSGFSLFSPQGLQWIANRTGTTELPRFIKTMIKRLKKTLRTTAGPQDPWSPMPRELHEPPPPKRIADQWIKCKLHPLLQYVNVPELIRSRLFRDFQCNVTFMQQGFFRCPLRTTIFSHTSFQHSMVRILQRSPCYRRHSI
jgi:hypothetical protein